MSFKKVLEDLIVLLSPFAPHISEELWNVLGHDNSIVDEEYPVHNPKYLIETEKNILFLLMENLSIKLYCH